MTYDELSGYPGRGLLAGRCRDGGSFVAYFVTGRSEASRNRTVVRRPSGDICVVPMQGPSGDPLRHYVAITAASGRHFVGNGDHVEDISRNAADKADVFGRFRMHSYEPDPPILTPRILAAMDVASGWVGVGAVRHGSRTDREHVWLETQDLAGGSALTVRTYKGDFNEPQSHGDPSWTTTGDTVVDTAHHLWERLDIAVRVLVVAVDLRTGQAVMVDQQRPTGMRDLEA